MKIETYQKLENYMLLCMKDSAHDREHIYRVLYNALEIAAAESNVDYDVLIAACLLHDIGRQEQFQDPAVCHAMVGGEKAYHFLIAQGFSHEFCRRVRHCIETHRFRKTNQPQTIEAKILFDADKLDATGAIGIARTLMYKGNGAEPIYNFLPNGDISDGRQDTQPSFFREYTFKLEKLYDKFLTRKGAQLALQRREAAKAYYESLYREVSEGRRAAEEMLRKLTREEET